MSSPVSTGSIIGLSASLMGLGVIAVSLRFYARRCQKVSFKLDDWLIIPALICLIASAVTYILGGVKYQLGAPTDNSLPGAAAGISEQIVYGYQAEFVTLILQPWLLGFVKMSIVFFYRRIFYTGTRTWFSICSTAFIALTIVWTLTFFFAILFCCGTDIQANWGSFQEAEDHCDNTILLDEVYSILDFILDAVVFVMPLPLIWRLHMSIQRRLAVTVVFMVGALALVASCLRMAIIVNIALGYGQDTPFLGTTDPSLQTATFLYWTMLEQGLAVIVACLPTLRSLLSFQSLDSFIKSIQSTFSLGSFRTRRSGRSGYLYTSKDPSPKRIDGSETAITKQTDFRVDLERSDRDYEIPMVPQQRELEL